MAFLNKVSAEPQHAYRNLGDQFRALCEKRAYPLWSVSSYCFDLEIRCTASLRDWCVMPRCVCQMCYL